MKCETWDNVHYFNFYVYEKKGRVPVTSQVLENICGKRRTLSAYCCGKLKISEKEFQDLKQLEGLFLRIYEGCKELKVPYSELLDIGLRNHRISSPKFCLDTLMRIWSMICHIRLEIFIRANKAL